MPGVVLAFSAIPALMRLTRAGMIDALASDYIRTARAKGLSPAKIVLKHALRNAAMPVVSVAAVQLGFMLGGSIVTEAVFALHGVGYLAWESISKNDFPVVQAVVLLLALIYIGLTLLADMVNAVLDPRLRRRDAISSVCQCAASEFLRMPHRSPPASLRAHAIIACQSSALARRIFSAPLRIARRTIRSRRT